MPVVEYVTRINLPPEKIWDFVKDMGNWAPFLTGYQKHEQIDETDSIWTLRGDIGVLSREVQFKAHVTEWQGPEKVSFTLQGITEVLDGGGTLLMSAAAGPLAKVEEKVGPGRRLLNWLFRVLFRWMHGKAAARGQPSLVAAGPGSELKFTLRMDAGGPMGPMVNAMLAPALLPAAEDLANKIAEHLERVHGVA